MQKTYTIDGVDCANCALKIEEKIGSMNEVASAKLNFATQTLRVEFYTHQDDGIQVDLESAADKIEPGVTLKDRKRANHSHDHSHNHSGSGVLQMPMAKGIRFLMAGALFTAALLAPAPDWLTLTLFLSSYALSGFDVIIRAIKGMFRGNFFDENVLMTVATLGAWGIGETPEAVAVMLFYQFGELFQDAAVNRSRKSITGLLDLKPEFARISQGGNWVEVEPESLDPGTIIQVRSGERVPLDGTIITGEALGDTSALTGESMPRNFSPGDEILSGVICQDGLLTIEVTKNYESSTVARIMNMVEEAADRKAPMESFITKFAKIYTPAVFAGAAILFLIPSLITGEWSEWLYRSLVFLVISCPCALVVSIPLSIFAGLGTAARHGVLIKGGNYLDALGRTEIVVFDKTGTLTAGKFSVTAVNPVSGTSKDQLLKWVAEAESGSNHPLARAMREEISQVGTPQSFKEIRGRGIEAILTGSERALAGSRKYLEDSQIPNLPNAGGQATAIHLAINGEYKGWVELSDTLKADAAEAVTRLNAQGVSKIAMLTGDTAEAAAPIASALGISDVHASLLPENKVEELEALDKRTSPKGTLIFVGDGINDAPVLARADVGIAMGGLGSDAAIEAADVVIMNDEPSRIADGVGISRRTRRILIQNITLALTIKGLVLLLGALGFASLWAAVFADVGTALIAILNALRVLGYKSK